MLRVSETTLSKLKIIFLIIISKLLLALKRPNSCVHTFCANHHCSDWEKRVEKEVFLQYEKIVDAVWEMMMLRRSHCCPSSG